eukprot:1992185-Rhodomonas_salina.1
MAHASSSSSNERGPDGPQAWGFDDRQQSVPRPIPSAEGHDPDDDLRGEDEEAKEVEDVCEDGRVGRVGFSVVSAVEICDKRWCDGDGHSVGSGDDEEKCAPHRALVNAEEALAERILA